MRTLLTGGSGFIAAHVLERLLKGGHSVVTTVRSQAKADKIREAHPQTTKDQLDFAIVEDIAQPGAFDHAVKSDPPFEAVIHTASPFHFNAQDIQKDLLDPAYIGTTGVLKAIKANAPTVKKVVITSSFAAIVNPPKPAGYKYSEKDWNTMTQEQALENQANGYRASKAFAERAAWDFLEKEKPNFTVTTMNPPLVLGPIVHYLNSLDALNTSNQRVRNFIRGDVKKEIPDTGIVIWTDVRDIADAHVKAIEIPEAANKRFFITQGYMTNKEIIEIIRKNFPEYQDKLPAKDVPGGTLPDDTYSFDNSQSTQVLGMKYRGLEESIVDLVKSLQRVGA